MPNYDPLSLQQECIAAGLRIHGCASDGRIDWIAPPTQAEQNTATAVLAAHDPAKRERDDLAERTGIRAVVQRLLDHTKDPTTWMTLTATDRLEDTRIGLRALALLIRRTIQ